MFRRHRALTPLVITLGFALLLATPASAQLSDRGSAGRTAFPTLIDLPDGFQPEGITIGGAPVAYLGSLADGSIYRANLITGRGAVISEGPGTPSVGLKIDYRERLFVAGGPAGDGRVVDARDGQIHASYAFAAAPTFVNDVVLTRDAAYFTDSLNPVLYKLPLGKHGRLPEPDEVVRIPLTGDLVFTEGFNVNGIARTPDGKGLLVIQSNTGLLFRVDPGTGVARTVDLGGVRLNNGDGLLVAGRTLYVVQNVLNTVAVVRLNSAGTSGAVVDQLTDPRFDVPTTVAAFGNLLYLPNARFGTPPEPTTPYTVVAIPAR